MDPVLVNSDDNSAEEPSLEELTLPSTPELCGISGDPQAFTRIGHEYQAEIPLFISEPEKLQPLLHFSDSEPIFDGYHFFIGLPMPVTWIPEKPAKETKNPNDSPYANAQVIEMDNGQEPKPVRTKAEVKHENKYLVPYSLIHSWSDSEVDSFILGLYLFGKNFVKIKRFLSKKEMGDILAFYYGDFYRSHGYCRWSDRLRARRKKCIYGRKLFTGWRKEELLSRLHPHVPEESRNSLLEVSAAFSEGRVSLENYVCKLKSVVGIEALVDAIGIGKAQTDLTSLSMEPGKSNPLFAVCPSRKACSSLTCGDIIYLLTGGFRLSKARCNDIFWEAVWPRLLARGWHSEQPRNQNFLVFLIPGVKKFSKRKLVKGKQYFDSVSDVLSKVATEPKLIELEDEEAKADSNEEESCEVEEPTGQYLKPRVPNLKIVRFTVVDSSSSDGGKVSKMREMRYGPHDLMVKSLVTSLSSGIEMRYLNSQESKVDRCKKESGDSGSNRTQFTIVDTSLRSAENSLKVRELRYAPKTKDTSRKRKRPSKGSLDVGVSESKIKLLNEDAKVSKVKDSRDTSESDEEPLVNRKIRDKSVKTCLRADQNESGSSQSTRTIKHQFSRRPKSGDSTDLKPKFSRRPKSGDSTDLKPIVKQRKLTACSNSDLSRVIKSFSVGQSSKREGHIGHLNLPDKSCCDPPHKPSETPCFGVKTCNGENAGNQTRETCIDKSSKREGHFGHLNSPDKDSSNPPQKPSETPCFGVEESNGENTRNQTGESCIDKCQPQVSLNSGNDEREPLDLNGSTEELNVNPIRQSKRNRPLTTRALEALEYGFISMKRQRSIPAQRKRKATPNNVSVDEEVALEERVANGAIEKKDLAGETPVESSGELNLDVNEIKPREIVE